MDAKRNIMEQNIMIYSMSAVNYDVTRYMYPPWTFCHWHLSEDPAAPLPLPPSASVNPAVDIDHIAQLYQALTRWHWL